MSNKTGSMPRYFFHVRDNQELVEDTEGLELPDIESVSAQCTKIIMEVLSENEWQHHISPTRAFQVVDELGQVVLIVPFGDVPQS